MEQERSDSCEEQRHLDGKPLSVEIAVYQNRDQDGGTEHREQMLDAQNSHLSVSEFCSIINWLTGIHTLNALPFMMDK